MDITTEKDCIDKISSLIFDAQQKVTLKAISNSWLVSNDIAEEILKKWTQQNVKKDLVKEYLVQGIDSKEKFTIAVVNEETKKKVDEKWKEIKRSWLYSVETNSNSRDLNLSSKYEEIKVKNIFFDGGQRDLQVPKAVKQESMDTTKIKTPFGMVKPVAKKVEESDIVQKQKIQEKSVDVKKPVKTKRSEKRKETPVTSKPSTSKNAKKNTKHVQKGSITSFFSKPSSSCTNTKIVNGGKKDQQESLLDVEDEKMEVDEVQKVKIAIEGNNCPQKFALQPPTTKKAPQKKQKESETKKRSRVEVIDDSREEKEEDKCILEGSESKLIKFDREVTPELKIANSRPPTLKLQKHSASKNKAVDNENRKVAHKNSPKKKAIVAKTKSRSNVTEKTKQGSIMNFFTKI